jgi:hypothetical protein
MSSQRNRLAWNVVLAAALLFAQWASVLHGFEHVRYDLGVAHRAAVLQGISQSSAADQSGGESLPALDHSRDHCIVFHALDCAVAASDGPVLAQSATFALTPFPAPSARAATRPPFSSRAPPVLS